MPLDPSALFRVEPEKPNVGSVIRLIGWDFEPLCHLEFFLNDMKIMDFCANDDGKFSSLAQIPDNITPDRYNFIVKDIEKNERKISLRIGILI